MPGRSLPVAPRQGVANRPSNAPEPASAAQPTIHIGSTATAPNSTGKPASTAANLPPSLADKPAGTAEVTIQDGSLSVDANNSSLSDILKKLEAASGMTVDGFDKDSRVFGVYGPGTPRDVLSSLLDGAGYNFLMVGSTSDGAPREVVLTARSNAPVSAPAPGSNSQPDEEDDTPNYPPPQQMEPPTAQPPVMPPPAEQRPRTPQEMLQELQRLRQQQQQQQPNQPQQ